MTTRTALQLYIANRRSHRTVELQFDNHLSKEETKHITKICESLKRKQTKLLAPEIIATKLKLYPHLVQISLAVMFELCTDKNAEVRKTAIKKLPELCARNIAYASHITDILVRLLSTKKVKERIAARDCLNFLITSNSKPCLSALLHNITIGSTVTRTACLTYLLKNIKPNFNIIFRGDKTVGMVFAEVKQVLQIVDAYSFDELIDFLSCYKSGKLVNLYETEKTLRILHNLEGRIDHNCLCKVIRRIKGAINLFSPNFTSNKIFKLLLGIVVHLEAKEQQKYNTTILDILRLLADIVKQRSSADDPDIEICATYQLLVKYLPNPTLIRRTLDNSAKHLYLEPLLFIFQYFAVHYPWLSEETLFRDLRSRALLLKFDEDNYVESMEITSFLSRGRLSKDKIKWIAYKSRRNVECLLKHILLLKDFKRSVYYSWKLLAKK